MDEGGGGGGIMEGWIYTGKAEGQTDIIVTHKGHLGTVRYTCGHHTPVCMG